MGHDHHHHHAGKNIGFAFFLNFGFTILEIIGGLYTNSIAILSDAVHDLGDSLALGMAWWLNRVSQRPGNRRFSFGYQRFSLLGALITSLVLIGGSVFIISEATNRLMNPQQPMAEGMLYFAIFGILVNGIAVLRMRHGKSLNEKLVTWHLLEDVLGWVAVLIVSIVLMFYNIPILDPILAMGISLFVLYNVFKHLRDVLKIFLQAAPDDVNLDEIESGMMAIEKVDSVHHTHVWSFDGEKHVLTAHIVLEQAATLHDVLRVKNSVKEQLRQLPVIHSTIEIELAHEDCFMKGDC